MLVSKELAKNENIHTSERRLRFAFEQSPIALQVFNSSGRCIEVNKAWEKLWGLRKEEVKDYNILKDPQLMQSQNADKILAAFEGHHVEIAPHYYEPSKSGKPGRPRWVKAIYYPLLNEKNIVEEIVLVLMDVTDMKKSEEILKEKNEELRRTNEAMIGRELRMADLKKEIERLRLKLKNL